MTVNIAYSGTADGYARSQNSDYTTCRNGSNLIADSSATASPWGQAQTGGNLYWNYQTFETFAYSVAATELVVAAYLRVYDLGSYNPGLTRALQFYEYAWGASVGTDDWRNAAWWSGQTPLLRLAALQACVNQFAAAGSDSLVSRLQSGSSPLQLVSATDRQAAGIVPSVQEDGSYNTSDADGTASDPALVWLTIPKGMHAYAAAAQVRLSDGTWVYAVVAADLSTITLRHRTNATTYVDIDSLPLGSSSTDFAKTAALQSLALVRDASDNLFVIGAQGSATGSIAAKAYTKGAGYTWTAGTLRAAALPAHYDAGINNVAAAWHNVGTSGTIVVVAAHGYGRWNDTPTSDTSYALLNCAYLLTGSGALLRNSGSALGVLVRSSTSGTYYSRAANVAGSGLDVQVPATAGDRGYVFCWDGNYDPGVNTTYAVARYVLASDGTSFSSTAIHDSANIWSVKDANSKVRILPISDSLFAVVSADSDSGYGISVKVFQNVGTSSTFTRLGYITLDGEVASMPPASTMAATAAWDAVYDAAENAIWVYYIDTANARRLMRTSIDLNSYLANADEVQVTAALGTGAGSTAQSIRCEHNARSGNAYTLVTVAISTSGTLTSDVYVDALNQAPTAPTLTPEPNYDATAAATFEWTFNDPNVGASQSAFQFDINTSAGADIYDSGKLGAAITYVGAGAVTTGNNASLTPAMPAGWTAGDLLLILASIRNSGTGTVAAPTGWTALATSGNVTLLGRIALSTDTAPTVTFSNGAANADTLAQMIAFRGTDQAIATVVHASAGQLNSSAANVAYPALTVATAGCAVLAIGWKQDDWTSVATLSGMTEISDTAISTAGDDAAQCWDYVIQTTAANISASSFTVTGGASAISRGLVVALRPYPTPTVSSLALPANTLTNGAAYRWRVRTWDEYDAVSPWADYLSLSCAAGGNVTITTPSTDNPAGVVTDDYAIGWSVTGTTQAAYRVVVTRSDTGASLLNTGWVSSTATTYTITGLLSDVQYQVAVTVRNAALVESGTGTRLITSSYSAPEVPTITVTPVDADGYVYIEIINPDPGTVDLGTSADGFEAGVTGYSVSGCTFTATSAQKYAGSSAALLSVSAGPPASAYARRTVLVSIEPSSRYTVSYRAYSPSAAANVADSIWWFDASSAALSSSSAAAAVSAGTWTARSYTATAPASAAYATYGPLINGPSASQQLYVDELLFAGASDRPAPTGNQLHRRRADGTGPTIVIVDETELAADGAYRDYGAGSGIEYEWRARAVANTGSSDSAWSAETLALEGVWLHDPLDPEGTVRQYRYGRSSRSEAVGVPLRELQFAGRSYPVVEYGSQRDDTWTVRLVVPHGPTWAADLEALRDFAAARRTLVFRDNRGRAAYVSVSGYQADDRDEGTGVSLAIRRVDWTEATV